MEAIDDAIDKNSPLAGVKPQVLNVPAYTLHAYEADIKLNQNENPFDFPGDLKDEVFRRFREYPWSRYPDFVPDSLRQALSKFTGWPKDGILVGNGSNELLQSVLMTLVSDGTPVAIPVPTFTVYRLIATVLGARVIDIPLGADMAYDIDAIIEKARGGSKEGRAGIVVINNPNNPTGSAIDEAGLRRVLDEYDGFVLLDEAYYEFGGYTGFELLKEFPRLIITRTFSKAMGMASLRLGYMMAHPRLAEQVSKAKLPYNVNQFSLVAAETALEHIERFQPAIATLKAEKEKLGKALGEVPGVRAYPSRANFFLVEVPREPHAVFEALYAKGILVRDVSHYPTLGKCLRISVGTPRENERLLQALREAVR
ncbi:MAG: histidinol-phosphate transaminase [Acidobacteriota bacterium]|jgi:histidinol-phosphate aminotransferase|nr:histidinol-phosphate transaminase [Acidobacteriota bacterium]